MTVSVRPWDQIAADLRRWNMVLTREAADAGDALAADNNRLVNRCAELQVLAVRDRIAAQDLTAVVAAVHTALDQYWSTSAIAKAVGR